MAIACGLAVLAAFCGPVFPQPPPVSSPPRELIALRGGVPGEMALARSGLWVSVYAGRRHNRVVGVDPDRRRVFARVPLRGSPFYLAAGRHAVWVTGNFVRRDDVLYRIDPSAERVVATIPLPGRYAGRIALGRRGLWVLTANGDVSRQWLVKVDTRTNAVVRRVPLPGVGPRYVEALDVGRGFVWLLAVRVGRTRELPGDVLRFDPRSNRITARIDAEALGMELGPGGMWITGCLACRARPRTDFAQRIDLNSMRPAGPRIGLRGIAFGPLFVGRERVWFGGYDESERAIAFSLDPESGRIERLLRASPTLYSGMSFDGHRHALWVARAPGGILRVDLADR